MCKLCGHEHDLGASHIFDGPKQPLSPPDELEAPMTEAERRRYDELKSNALVHWAIVGEALTEIRDSRLYREEHATFEAFCQDVFSMTHRRANQLIAGAAVASVLGTIVPKEALKEGTVRPLAGLPADQAREVYRTTTERVGPAPRARDIQQTMNAGAMPANEEASTMMKMTAAVNAVNEALRPPELLPGTAERVLESGAGDHTLPSVFGSPSMTHHDPDPTATAEALTAAEEEADRLGEGIRYQGEPAPARTHLDEDTPLKPPARASDVHASLERSAERLADAADQIERLHGLTNYDRRQLENDLSTMARAIARLQQLLALKG